MIIVPAKFQPLKLWEEIEVTYGRMHAGRHAVLAQAIMKSLTPPNRSLGRITVNQKSTFPKQKCIKRVMALTNKKN